MNLLATNLKEVQTACRINIHYYISKINSVLRQSFTYEMISQNQDRFEIVKTYDKYMKKIECVFWISSIIFIILGFKYALQYKNNKIIHRTKIERLLAATTFILSIQGVAHLIYMWNNENYIFQSLSDNTVFTLYFCYSIEFFVIIMLTQYSMLIDEKTTKRIKLKLFVIISSVLIYFLNFVVGKSLFNAKWLPIINLLFCLGSFEYNRSLKVKVSSKEYINKKKALEMLQKTFEFVSETSNE